MSELIKDVADTPVKIEPGTLQIHNANMSPEALISQAIDAKVPVETMEKLLAMRRELKEEQSREVFMFNLACFQGECPVIGKNKAVLNKDKKTVRYHYAPLDDIVSQVQGLLKKYGFSYTIQTINEKDPDGQRSVCTVHHVEGHSRESEFWAPVDHEAYMSDQQKWAAASTYGKRYAFCNALGILTGDEDNDAQDAGNGKPPQPQVDGSAMKALHTQILKDMSNEHFGGHIDFEGVQTDLDNVRIAVNEFLSGSPNLKQLTKAADRVARMLLIAEAMDAEAERETAEAVTTPDPREDEPDEEEQLSDAEIADVFQGELVDVETKKETEGNLSG